MSGRNDGININVASIENNVKTDLIRFAARYVFNNMRIKHTGLDRFYKNDIQSMHDSFKTCGGDSVDMFIKYVTGTGHRISNTETSIKPIIVAGRSFCSRSLFCFDH